ncbi:MAG: glucokinase [Pseudorhodoplanes sp.]|nr:glucokinase [Pseudorhodoplanes sp.]
MSNPVLGLVGDIGATHARFALLHRDGTLTPARVFACADFADIAEAITDYLAKEARAEKPVAGALAIAAAVVGEQVKMTNHPWSFSVGELRKRLGLDRLRVINDFAANALSIPELCESDLLQVGTGSPEADAPVAIIGPGSGLGVGALLPDRGSPIALASEGGHVTMPAADMHEAAVLDLLRQRFEHVSAERVLSGPGLVNLYTALCALAGETPAPLGPAQIADPGIGKEHPQAAAALSMFCAMLGTVAGNLALTLGARGGVYIAGGIVPKLGRTFAESAFRARFEAKGRFGDYLKNIPTYVVVRPLPALLGAARLLREC